MNRLFVLREARHVLAMKAMIQANWESCSAAGHPLGVTIAPYRKTRTSEQNALMWVWLGQIAEQAFVGGRRFDADVWHEHIKRALLPELNARGDAKWRDLPALGGAEPQRVLAMSTTRLNTEEMSLYMEQMAAFTTTELGVNLT
jgi:hypothetical protein